MSVVDHEQVLSTSETPSRAPIPSELYELFSLYQKSDPESHIAFSEKVSRFAPNQLGYKFMAVRTLQELGAFNPDTDEITVLERCRAAAEDLMEKGPKLGARRYATLLSRLHAGEEVAVKKGFTRGREIQNFLVHFYGQAKSYDVGKTLLEAYMD